MWKITWAPQPDKQNFQSFDFDKFLSDTKEKFDTHIENSSEQKKKLALRIKEFYGENCFDAPIFTMSCKNYEFEIVKKLIYNNTSKL